MRKLSVAILVLAILTAASAAGQDTYFGKNKVQYKNFEWNFIQTRHFDIYFYENAYPTAKFSADALEAAYDEISREIDYKLQNRIPVFLYNSHNDFQQTNIISSLLPEGVGGFTEALKKRIAVPFDGSYEDLRHVLHHELTHAMIYDMMFGNSLASVISRQRLFDMPLWFSEGYAEYSSRHGWDYFADMYVRDQTINDHLVPPIYLYGYPAYKQGQAMVKYIVDKYGEDKLGEIIRKGRIHLTMNRTLESVLGIDEEKFFEEFTKEMKRRYWPSIVERKEADEIGKQLTKAREDGSYFNEKPEYSPEGDAIAIFTDKSDFTEIVMLDALTGKHIKSLVKSERSGDLESLHSFVTGASFSPDGKKMVFVAKSKGKASLFFVDVARSSIYLKERFDYYNIVNPRWSPDGTKVVFSALDSHKRDLFIYDIATQHITQITDDRFDDTSPDWLPDSQRLVFASDRPHPQNPVIDALGQPYVQVADALMPGDFAYGTYNIFQVDIATRRIEPIDVGPGQNRAPRVSPDGRKLAFISNRNGIDNLYIGYLDEVNYFAVTDALSSIQSHSWSPDGDKIVFSAFFKGAYDIFVLTDIKPQGKNGVLAPTAFVKGDYDLVTSDGRELTSATADTAGAEIVSDEVASTDIATADSSAPAQNTLAVTTDSTATVQDTLAVAAVDVVADTAAEATGDSTQMVSDSTTEAVTETGVYDDEYVFVSDADESALDRVMTNIPRDSLFGATRLEEPAKFDSVPPLLPSGEYRINKYKVKFTPDFVGGGFAYDTFFGVRGQTYFVFSDYLGNHEIVVATDLVNTIDQSYIQGYYFNSTRRTNLGAGFFHSKNYYIDSNDSLFSDRFYGIQGFARRPFSTFGRVEAQLSQFFIDRKYEDRAFDSPDRKRSSKITTFATSYVFDNVLWGYTAPVNGTRYKLTFDAGVNLFNSDDISFYSVGFDYRKYWHIAKTASMAFRVSGGASFGETPKRYFLGGTTNWIGSRTLDPTVYEVESLYFSDVVTPLRGQKYYDIDGDRYALINWEFRFPTIQIFAMRYPLPLVLSNVTGAVFFDMGAAWYGDDFKLGSSAGGYSRLQDVKTGFGVGLRLPLFGFILLRYDLAWATDYYEIERPRSYFSFGADF